MKTNITHKILVLISKEATKRGYYTHIICVGGKWELYIFDKGGAIYFDRNTKISEIEEWMQA